MAKYVSAYEGAKRDKEKKKKYVSAYSEAEKNKYGIPGAVGYIAARAGTDFLRVGEGALDAALVPVDLLMGNVDKAKSRFMDSPVDAMRERLDEEYNPGKGMQVVGDIAGGIGQSIGYGLISAIPYAGKPIMYSSIIEQGISSAAQQTGNVGLKEIGYGVTTGAIEGALESKLGAGVNAAKGIGSAILKKSGVNVAKSAAKAGGGSMLRSVLTEVAKGAAGEFAEEAISEAVDPALLRLYNIDENAQGSLGNVLYAGVIGALSGGIVSAGPAAINYNTSVKVGRSLQEQGLDVDLVKRAKYTLQGFEIANQRAEAAKGEVAADDKKAAKAAKKNARQISKETAELADKIEKNIAAYERYRADPKTRDADATAAILGELRGNLFLVGMSYEVDTVEAVIKQSDNNRRQQFVDVINEMMAAQGKKHDYTLADLDNDTDQIRRKLAGQLTLESLMGVDGAQSPAEAQEDAWAGMPDGTDFTALGATGEAETALLREAINWSVPKASVSEMLNQYRKGTNLTPAEFAEAWSDGVHVYGRYGLNVDGTADAAFNRMEPEAREAAVKYGRETAEAETKAKDEAAKKKKNPAPKPEGKEKREGKVIKGEGLNVQKLSDEQYAAYKAAEVLAEVLGTDIVLETSIERDGKPVNGYYSRKTNRLHVNINAMRNGKSIALYTLGHEVTHYIKEWSPAKFKVIQDFVMKQMGVDAKTAIAEKMASLKRLDIIKDTMTVAEANDKAAEEVVADGMELILTDGKVLEELAHTDKSLWEKIRDWFFDIIGQIRRSWQSLNQASKTAQVLKETVESLEEIERLFTEGVKEAGERARTAEIGEVVQGEGGTMFSYIGETKDGRPCYVSGFDDSVDMDERIKVFKERIATIFNLGAVELKTDVKKIRILGDRFTAQKNIYGDLNNTPKEQAAKISSLYDLADILATSTYDPTATGTEPSYANPTIKPKNKAHENVKYWYKFRNEIVFDGVPYTVTFNIRDKGKTQYQYLIEFKENKTPGLSNTAVKGLLRTDRMSYEDSITQPEDSVNTSAENSSENSSDNLYSVDETAENGDVRENEAEAEPTDREILAMALEEPDTETEVYEGEVLPRAVLPFRQKLAEFLGTMIETDAEYKILSDYQKNIARLDDLQDQINQLNAKKERLQDILYTSPEAEERSDAAKKLQELYKKREALEKEMARGDREITRLQEMGPVKNMLRQIQKQSKQKYKEEYEAKQKASSERKEITIRMREARRVLGYLNTMLYHPTKQKHVPESLQALVEKALRSADPKQFGINRDHIREMSELAGKIRKLESKAGRTTAEQETLDKMKTKYEKLEADTISVKRQAEALMTAFEQYVKTTTDGEQIDKNMLEGLRQTVTEIEEAPLNEMTLESLKAVEKIYTVIYHQVDTANQAFATKKAAAIDEMSTEANTEVKNAKELKVLSPRAGEWAGMAHIRSFLWKNLKPLSVFEAIGSDKLMEIFRRVLDAEDVWITDILEAKKALDEAKKEFGYNKWNLKERREITTADGSKVSLTLGEMMSLYAYMFREQAEEHLSAGGFVFAPNAEAIESFKGDKVKYRTHLNDQKPYRMRKEDIGKMSEMLTEEQRAYAEAVQEYLTSLGAKGNEVSRTLYGIELFKETAYFPIKSSHDYIETSTGKSGDPNIKSRGTFKETVPRAGNPIVLEDFMEVVGNHVNTMATYHAFVLPVEDLTRVWNYTPVNIKRDADGKAILDKNGMPVADTEGEAGYNSLKAEITKKYGKEANDYILQLLRDLNGGARRESAASILDKGLTAFKRSATMLSLSTIVQQPTSIIRAMAYVEAKHFTGASFVPWETVKKYAPVAAIKEMAGFDTGTGARTAEYINAKQYDSIKDAAKAAVTPEIYGGDPNVRAEAFGWLTGKADEVSWRYLFGAVVNEQAEKLGKAKDSEEVLKAAGERFAEVVRRTQVYDSTLTRSEYMRSKDGLMKMATAFGAEPATVFSMVAEAIIKLERGDKTFFKNTAAAVAGSIILNAVVSSIIYAIRDDDEDKNLVEKYTESVTSEIIEGFNPLEYLPIARDVMSVFKGYDIERTDMSLVADLYKQVELITSSKRSPMDKIFGVSGAVASFFGIPITNVYRDAKGIALTTAGFLDPQPVTGRGVGKAVGEGFKGQFGLFDKLFGKDRGDSYELYRAYVKGDNAQYARIAARYDTPEDEEQALRRELRENDKRIVEAAEAKYSGELEAYESLVDQIEAEGIFDRNIVIRAVNNEVSELKRAAEKGELVPKDELSGEDDEETAESLYTASDLNAALERGDTEDYESIYEYLIAYKTEQGQTEAQAKSAVKSAVTSRYKKKYLEAWSKNDTAEMKRILALLEKTGLYGTYNETAKTVEKWVKDSAK